MLNSQVVENQNNEFKESWHAIVHKDYGSGTPIQIRVYHHKIRIFNTGGTRGHWEVLDVR